MNDHNVSELKVLQEQLKRERAARRSAEQTLESVSLELTRSNKSLIETAQKNIALLKAIDEFDGSVLVLNQDEICTYVSEKTLSVLGIALSQLLNKPIYSVGVSLLIDQYTLAKRNELRSTGYWGSDTVSLPGKQNLLEFSFFHKEGSGTVIVIADVTKSVSQRLAFKKLQEELDTLDHMIQQKLKGEDFSHKINASIAAITALAETVDRSNTEKMIAGIEQIKLLGYDAAREMQQYESELTRSEAPEIVNLEAFIEELSSAAGVPTMKSMVLKRSGFERPLLARFDRKTAKFAVYSAFRLLRRANKSNRKLSLDVHGSEEENLVRLTFNIAFLARDGACGLPAFEPGDLADISRLPSLIGFDVDEAVMLEDGIRIVVSKPSPIEKSAVMAPDIVTANEHVDITRSQKKPDVIVVEDDKLMNELICEFVHIADFKAVPFLNPKEALAFLNNQLDQTFIVISDYLMPDMRGDELALAIKKARPSTPVILYSAQASYKISEKDRYFDVLKKPVSPEQLSAALNAAALASKQSI